MIISGRSGRVPFSVDLTMGASRFEHVSSKHSRVGTNRISKPLENVHGIIGSVHRPFRSAAEMNKEYPVQLVWNPETKVMRVSKNADVKSNEKVMGLERGNAIMLSQMDAEKNRLSEYHKYEDGNVDQPFLTPDTVKDDN